LRGGKREEGEREKEEEKGKGAHPCMGKGM